MKEKSHAIYYATKHNGDITPIHDSARRFIEDHAKEILPPGSKVEICKIPPRLLQDGIEYMIFWRCDDTFGEIGWNAEKGYFVVNQFVI